MTLRPPIDAYFDSLVARVSTSTVVPLFEKAYTEADYNNCHDNAAKWVVDHPEYQVVRGWLLWPQAGRPYMLHAHSVVSGPAGLLDVTPLRDSGLHFLEHQGSEQAFSSLAKNFAQYTHGLDLDLSTRTYPPSQPG